jgi:hypothetical protein
VSDDDVLRLAAQVLGNPLLFEDLKQDFTVHTEADDWIKFARAIEQASRRAALSEAARLVELNGYDGAAFDIRALAASDSDGGKS